MKKMFLAIVLLLAVSVNAKVMFGPGVRTLGNDITGQGLVSIDALQGSTTSSNCGCSLFSCDCGC
jgi:hypothetical protein